MAEEITKEMQAVDRADATGLGDTFSFENEQELTSTLFSESYIADPTEPYSQIDLREDPRDLLENYGKKKLNMNQEFFTSGRTKKGLFEKMFGYDPSEVPLGYEKMSPFKRAVLRADLAGQNITTRMGIAATKQLKGTLQLAMPKSMEEFFELNKIGTKESALEEDVYYERSIQTALKDKQKDGVLPEEEDEQLKYLNETLPSGIQKLPEFTARVGALAVEVALASEIFNLIPLPGGDTLANHLSEVGKRTLGRFLSAVPLNEAAYPATKIALNTLVKQIERFGVNAGELFTWGFISAEEDESRVIEGAKMSAWAAVPVLVAPLYQITTKGPVGKKAMEFLMDEGGGYKSDFGKFIQRVVAKTAAPIADKLSQMADSKAKKTFVNKAMIEADDIFFKETGQYMNASMKKSVKEVFNQIADDTSKIARGTADDISGAIKRLSADVIGKDTIGAENVIPKSLRSPETAGDRIIQSVLDDIQGKTNLAILQQPNGRYAILNKETLAEVAVDVKRNKLSETIDDILFGVDDKLSSNMTAKKILGQKTTSEMIADKVQLKRLLGKMQTASNDGFRAGTKSATEKYAIRLNDAKERIQTIKLAEKEKWENVEFARQLVKEFVPKEDQHLFLNRLIKSKTEGKLDIILDDIQKHVDRKRVGNLVDSIRESLKKASSKYSDKSGKFAKAPDEVRPILESLDKMSNNITKLSQQAPDAIDNIGSLASGMIDGINKSLSGRGEVIGLSDTFMNDLYNLSDLSGQPLTVDNLETISQLARIVIHRTEQAQNIKVGAVTKKVAEVIEDSSSRILDRGPTKAPKRSIPSLAKQAVGVESDHPATLITKMFGRDSNAMQLLDDLYEGENKAFGVMRNSFDYIREYMRVNNLSPTVLDDLSQKIDITAGGKVYSVTRNDILGLAMATRDPFVFDNLTKTRGLNFGGYNMKKMTTDEIANAISNLSPEELKMGGAFFSLSNDYLGNIVNQTSLELNGIKIATYPQYFPSHRQMSIKAYGNKYSAKTAETQSNFMPRIGGTARMRINPFERELMDYVQNASMYHGTSVPMRSVKTMFADKGLQDQLRNSGYEGELSNFMEIIARSEGLYSDSSVIDIMGQQALNRFTKAKLGARVSTIGTQMASVPAAKSVIPGKYFRVTDTLPGGQVIDDLMNSSDMLWYRWHGRRVSLELGDVSSGSSISHFIKGKTPLSEKPLSGMIWGDKQAIGKIHLASRRMIADTTNLVGAEAERAAVSLTEKATRLTQPNWSPLTRSKLATDVSVFKRSITMFRTAQETQQNILKRGNAEFMRTGDWGELTNAYKSVGEASMNVAVWKTLWKHSRNAAITSVAGWLGVSVIDDNKKSIESDLAKNILRTASDLVPLGRQIESLTENAITAALGEGKFINTANDPISTIITTTADATTRIAGWVDLYRNSIKDRTGYDVDMMDVSLDDMLKEIARSEEDQDRAISDLKMKLTKDILKGIETAGLFVGAPTAPIDEWVYPSLKRSPYKTVNQVDSDNASNPVRLSKNLHRFLSELADLQKKSDESGLTKEESERTFEMKLLKDTSINVYFGLLDIVDDDPTILDPVDESIKEFYK